MSRELFRPFEPLPGTEPPLRGLFVDRWGTLLELPGGRANPRFADARFTPGALDALFRAQQAGWSVYLIGNEDAVARGRWAQAAWEEFESALLAHLSSRGIDVVRNYACLDHPEGKGTHRRNSVFLLPDTGLYFHAAQVDGVVLSESWTVGDSTLELVAGGRAGCKVASVATGLALSDRTLDVEPDVGCCDLAEAVRVLLALKVYARR